MQGSWALTVDAAEIPGGNAALPVSRTWQLSLQPGEPQSLAGPSAGHHASGSGSGVRSIIVVALVIAVAVAGLDVFRGRRAEAL
jgi:hypothetical protein